MPSIFSRNKTKGPQASISGPIGPPERSGAGGFGCSKNRCASCASNRYATQESHLTQHLSLRRNILPAHINNTHPIHMIDDHNSSLTLLPTDISNLISRGPQTARLILPRLYPLVRHMKVQI